MLSFPTQFDFSEKKTKMADDIKFSVLASLFTWMQRSKSSAKKRLKFRKFLDTFCKPSDYFSAIRLILPNLDRERGTYGLKEYVLATCIIDALGMSRESEDAIKLINWRKGGAKTGSNAGNFALVAAEVLQRRQGMISFGLSIKELNETLDHLASKDSREEKTSILSNLIRRTNAQEMKWIVMIILKDLKLGITEKSIFHEFHPDAEDIFNVTCDLKLVCEKLKDRRQRHKRQDIEVGKAVRPQLAMRVSNANIAWKKLHGKEVVVECKFDGDRIQIHKNGTELHFFSRNYLDHAEYEHAMSDVIIHNVLVDRCILDGEMLVWDYSLNRFAEFGSNQEIAKAAKDGLDDNRQLCYVVFDILYAGDTSVIHQSLKERHELLRKVVKPLKGRLEILLPVDSLKVERPSGEPCWSMIANSVDDVERFFNDTIENRDEGVVIKDLDSKWEPGDRSGKWLKLKPDYIRAGSDLDVLIIGGYYGSGRRGGEVAQFLVGLADRPSSNTYPTRFISFCRVGTGLSDDELNTVVNKLKPYFRKNDYPKSAPPKFYQVTNNSKERPDVWIESPEKSLILSVTSDIRTINSEVFAAPYSLRFPRVDRVRYDKPWHECLDVQCFIHLVQSSNGTTKGVTDYSGLQYGKLKQVEPSRKGEKRIVPVVPSHLVQTDISDIKGDSLIFSNMMFYIANVPPNYSLDSIHKMIVENGGTFSMNLNNSVTHCVAENSKGIRYEAAKRHGDVINCSWVMDSSLQKALIPLQPKYFLHLSDSSKKKLLEEIDEYSDSYYCDLQSADIKQLLDSMERSEDTKNIDYYKRKYCPKGLWRRFLDCHIYFHLLVESLNANWEILSVLSLRRLKVDVVMGGGKICDDIASATHLIVFSEPGTETNYQTVLKSVNATEKNFQLNHKLQIVGSQWLEDCMERGERLKEDSYSLKPIGMKELNEKGYETNPSSPTMLDDSKKPQIISLLKQGVKRGRKTVEKPPLLASTGKAAKRKVGRSSRTVSQKGKAPVVQTRRPRIQKRKGPAKICNDELDETSSNEENTIEKAQAGNKRQKMAGQESSDVKEEKVVEAAEPSHRGEVIEAEFIEKEASGKQNFLDIETMEKSEHKTDRVEAMLLDMIPSLGLKKIETAKEDFKSVKQPSDQDVIPTKKKKVSYKDVADKLLKDW